MCTIQEKIKELEREIKSAKRDNVDKDLIADMEARLESLEHEAKTPTHLPRPVLVEED